MRGNVLEIRRDKTGRRERESICESEYVRVIEPVRERQSECVREIELFRERERVHM